MQMHRAVHTILLAWEMLRMVSGQQPLTPGVGQYCSHYITGFTSNLGGKLDVHAYTPNGWSYDCVTHQCSHATVCDCSYMTVCANQANPACPWAVGASCGIEIPCSGCANYALCSDYKGTSFCNPGCVTVSPRTQLPSNAYFTGSANPSTSASGCPWACNTGYTKSGSTCIPSPCITCNNGYFSSGCAEGSSGTCVACTN
jgi:hypothetical protein